MLMNTSLRACLHYYMTQCDISYKTCTLLKVMRPTSHVRVVQTSPKSHPASQAYERATKFSPWLIMSLPYAVCTRMCNVRYLVSTLHCGVSDSENPPHEYRCVRYKIRYSTVQDTLQCTIFHQNMHTLRHLMQSFEYWKPSTVHLPLFFMILLPMSSQNKSICQTYCITKHTHTYRGLNSLTTYLQPSIFGDRIICYIYDMYVHVYLMSRITRPHPRNSFTGYPW